MAIKFVPQLWVRTSAQSLLTQFNFRAKQKLLLIVRLNAAICMDCRQHRQIQKSGSGMAAVPQMIYQISGKSHETTSNLIERRGGIGLQSHSVTYNSISFQRRGLLAIMIKSTYCAIYLHLISFFCFDLLPIHSVSAPRPLSISQLECHQNSSAPSF